MKITLTGATGFLGSHLVTKLLDLGHEVHALGRKRGASLPRQVTFSEWNAQTEPPATSFAGVGAVIHLAGEPVAQRWTAQAKARIHNSRVEGTRLLVNGIRQTAVRPPILICASAIGLYGSRGDEPLTETSAPGQGFLADVVRHWEMAARSAESLEIRVVLPRFGVVLGKGGALEKMLPPFRFGLGGRIGSGRQWMSWIHVEDAVGMILFALENETLAGPMNATSSNPVTNLDFTRELARALHRPAVFPIPELGLKLLFGEMAGVLLASQRVLPKAAKAAGFQFQYPDLRSALADILKSSVAGSDAQ
jgi:uncharacterized protein